MENQTITSLGEPEDGECIPEDLIAHKLFYHWWGGSVSSTDWHHVWLNEGFATYSEALWMAQRFAYFLAPRLRVWAR